MFVLGTAGHIDHGKSSLVRALTGIDPDRLPEEKARGMTIDLGFAWFTLPDGSEVGLVDVPGHERFVRNMVAGAGGINAAVLVIAADDGWMPQTQEHFDILNLLDIKYGFIAVTKIDLVDREWLELVGADIAAKVRGSFLDGAPIIFCSTLTREGIDQVSQAIGDIARRLSAVDNIGKARLFVDRAFVLTGIGVVVTGTSRGGAFAIDSDVYRFPGGDRIRIRSLQSHERKVDRVGPGTRVAMNLTGVERTEINRGQVITSFSCDRPATHFAVWIKNLDNSATPIKEGRKVLFILGTTETEALARPFADQGIKPGETGLAVIKTSEPVAAFLMDTFILRLPTPQVTIGGGRLLDTLDHFPRRKDLPALAGYLEARVSGELPDIIRTELGKRLFTPTAEFLLWSNFSSEAIASTIASLTAEKRLIAFDNQLAAGETINDLTARITKELDKTHQNKSYLKGLTAEELSRRVECALNDEFALLLRYLESVGTVGRTLQFYFRPGFNPVLDDDMTREADRIMAELEASGHSYLTFDDIETRHPGSRRTVNFLRDEGRIKTVGNQFMMTSRCWQEILDFLAERLASAGKVTVAEFRDRFGSSRKFALPVLEYLDNLGVTRRVEDYRVKGGRFDERHLV